VSDSLNVPPTERAYGTLTTTLEARGDRPKPHGVGSALAVLTVFVLDQTITLDAASAALLTGALGTVYAWALRALFPGDADGDGILDVLPFADDELARS
jgi:hypothetical protein